MPAGDGRTGGLRGGASELGATRRGALRLAALLEGVEVRALRGDTQTEVTAVVDDSRRAGPGTLFVAIAGLHHDGHLFAPMAAQRGAVALVVERELPELALAQVVVPDARRALGQLAAAFHGHPSRRLPLIGVTGTDGKTTTVHLIAYVLEAAGHQVGFISTVHAKAGGRLIETGLHTTTPEPLELQSYLGQMVEAGADYAVLETSSHALAQERVAGCDFDLAVLTNVTAEHLDYHHTYEEYLATKARLFESLSQSYRKPGVPKVAVLNADDPSYARLRALPADQHLAYGLEAAADVSAADIGVSADGIRFTACTPRGPFAVQSPLLGRFNVANCLAAIAVAEALGIELGTVQAGIAAMPGVPGRMEPVDEGQDFSVVVDFAVTPNALRQALDLLRSLTPGRVVVVFGCAGLRDQQKRPVMGEVAGRLADFTVITADDPRTEALDDIMWQIGAGCEAAGRRLGRDYWKVSDRAEAIAFAVRLAAPGDAVLLAGKGHERSLAIGEEERPWNEVQAAREALRRLGKPRASGRHGP